MKCNDAIAIFLIVFLKISQSFSAEKRSLTEQQLVSSIVIIGHGESTPLRELPSESNFTKNYWGLGPGQLLNEGKRKMYHLGEWFRDRYRDFLPENYSEKDLYVRSTDSDRSLMSAEVFLAGLYPPKNRQIWHENLSWQPIPIHALPKEQDALLAMTKICPHHEELLEELWEMDDFLIVHNQTDELLQFLSAKTDTEITNLENLLAIYDSWSLKENFANFSLPEWTVEIYPDQMYEWASFHLSLNCYNSELARLKSGLILNEIAQILLGASLNYKKHKTYRKFTVYVAHETTLANILQSLQLFDPHIPEFGSSIIFELQHWNGNYFVSIFYKNRTDLHEMTLNNCTFECPFADFNRILAPVRILPEDWDGECELKILGIIPTHMNHDVMVACGTLVLLLVILGLFAIWFACKGEKDSMDTSDSDSYLKQY